MAGSSLNQISGASLSLSSSVAAAAAAVVTSMMDNPYHHHHHPHHHSHYNQQDHHQPAAINGSFNSSTGCQVDQNNIPAHYNSYNYLTGTTNHNYFHPYHNQAIVGTSNNQSADHHYYASASSGTNEYQANSYATPTAINNQHHDSNNNQSSSLNTPTLDQTVSSSGYYPAFQHQHLQASVAAAAVASTPTANIYQTTSDYYFPTQYQQQQHSSDIGNSLYNHSQGAHHEPSATLFACPSQYPHHTSYLSSSSSSSSATAAAATAADASQSLHQLPAGCQNQNQQLQQEHHHGSIPIAAIQQQRTLEIDRAHFKGAPPGSGCGLTLLPVPAGQTNSGSHMQRIAGSQPETIGQQQKQTAGAALGPRQDTRHHPQQPLNGRTTSGSNSNPPASSITSLTNSPTTTTTTTTSSNLKAAQSRGMTTSSGASSSKMIKIQQRASHKAAVQRGLVTSGSGGGGGAAAAAAHHHHHHQPPSSVGGVISRRKNATRETTATLKDWLDEHDQNPYPTKGEKIMLSIITKMSLTQVSTWFANARRRMKKENKLFWGSTGKQGNHPPTNGEGGANLQAANRANRGTASSIRYFIHKHQKQLAGSSSMLALAGHRIQGRPFVFCPHIQSGSYNKQPAAAIAADNSEGNGNVDASKAPANHCQQPSKDSPIFKAMATSASASTNATTTTTVATIGSSPSPSSGSGSPSSSVSSGLGSPITTSMKPALVATTSISSRIYDDTY